jgi:hypothetical protein
MQYYCDMEALESSSRGERTRHRRINQPSPGVASTPPITRAKRMAKGVEIAFHTMFSTKLKVGVDALEEIIVEN